MPNPFSIAGAQPPKPSRKAPLYQGGRFSSGLWTNRAAIRDAASTRLEEKFYGPRGDAFLGGENLEISQRLTLIRRPGNTVWNSNNWTNVNSFYEFRLFNANTEQIKTMVDTAKVLYDASNNGQQAIWNKSPYAGQSYMQSVGNILFWGDGVSQKKWINTLQQRIPYTSVLTEIAQFANNTSALNPYNFTPFNLDSFVIDTNGNAEQLIGTVVQLSGFYILNSTVVFALKSFDIFGALPTASQILTPGLQLYFPATSTVAQILGSSAVTITVQNIVGGIQSASVFFGGEGYTVGSIANVNQTNPAGSMNGSVKVMSVGNSAGVGYTSAINVPTTTTGVGSGAQLNVTAAGGGLVSATIASGGVNYSVGDFVFPQEAGATGGYFVVTGVSVSAITSVALCTGCAKTVSVNANGTGYFTASNVPTTDGGGNGLTVNIVDDGTEFSANFAYGGGSVTNVTPNAAGSTYAVGDLVFPVIAAGSKATGAQFQVSAIYGSPSSLNLTYGGPTFTGYTPATNLPTTTSGAGTGLTFTILTVSGTQISTWSLGSSGGTGYNVGDSVFPTQASGAGAQYTVATVSGGGVVTSLTQDNPGFLSYSTGTNIPTTTSGAGTGLTININTVVNSAITSGSINTAGTGYAIGDRVYPTQAGTAGTATFTVTALSSTTGGVAALAINDAGTGYASGTYNTTTSGAGTGLTINLVVSNPSFFPPATTNDIPHVVTGGNPISDSAPNNLFIWNSVVGGTTIDGSALWFNRGPAVDGGLVYNWGLAGGTEAPSVVVNNAVAEWAANTYYNRWQFIVVSVSGNKYIQQLVSSGVSAGTAPAWNTTPGQITTDGTAKWICLSNDGDTALTWTANTQYSVGHVIEDTPGSTNCVYQLQPYSGIMTQGSSFPAYCWQCGNQHNSDVGAAGELPNGTGGNMPMAQNGGQTTTTATFTGTMNSLFLSAQGGSNPVKKFAIAGEGTLSGSGTTLFSGTQNLSIAMLPVFVIPAAGTYTFTIGHQVAMFWGIGNGSIDLNVTNISINGGVLTVTCDRTLDSLISTGINLTFAGLTNAAFLNGQEVEVTSVSGRSFTANLAHANYGPAPDSGTASSSASLVPEVISGPMNWQNSGNPNTYNFSTGTPIKGYKIMSAQYQNQGTSIVVDTVQINFPAAGVYPGEIQYGVWYHSTGGYSTPTVSPALPGTTFSFYMIYSPPGSSTNYNIIPQGIASSVNSTPSFPDWSAGLSGLQANAPAYPKVTEYSGNYTWWNLGPTTTFGWNASVHQTTQTFIIDQNSNEEVPYEAGVSGTTEPTFATVLYQLAPDIPNLVWMNNGPIGQTLNGTLTTTQGGWRYVVALVNTLDNTVSNASPASASTGNFFEASGVFVSGGLPEVIDPQADYVAIFRTDDGGATYFLIPPPASGNGNTEYTLPLAQYLAQGFTDTTPDSQLETLFEAAIADQNSVPPVGLIGPVYQYQRIFGFVDNVVYWSSGPDTPVGNGLNGFDPINFAEFPSLVKRLVPLNIGMLVFTVSDIYLISGNGTSGNPFSSQPFVQRVGLLSYNALTVNGSIVYFMTTDNQVMELNVHSGLSQIGFPIADLLQQFNPAASYLTWHVNGSFDQCLFVADGSTGWYRMCPTPAPETGSLTWSLKANIQGGAGAVQSVETTPGNIQLLLGPPPNFSGPILYRDYTTNLDNGATYPANFILGSIVMAFPGQVAAPEFIATDCLRVINSRPLAMGVRIGEISGPFEDLIFWTNDPPQLPPSETLYNQRFYLSQTKQSVLCRHLQIFGEFQETNSADELETITVYGGFQIES